MKTSKKDNIKQFEKFILVLAVFNLYASAYVLYFLVQDSSAAFDIYGIGNFLIATYLVYKHFIK